MEADVTFRKVLLIAASAVGMVLLLLTAARPGAQSFAAPAGLVPAPDPNVPLYFEAASVKPSNPASPGQSIRRQPGGRFNTINMPVRGLITFAYQIQSFQLVGGPSWLSNDRFDIVAKMEGDPPPVIPGTGADHMMLATRTLLADRFKLAMHKETRELDIYALTMARPGGKPGKALKPASGDCSAEAFARRGAAPPPPGTPPVVCGIQMSMSRVRFGGYPLSLFANSLSSQVGRFVVDRTGLTGNWDFDLSFTPDPTRGAPPTGPDAAPFDPNGPSLFTALQEQLGLKLEATKGPVEVWVIDSVQQPTPD
jgi:uncharacterized protein (TIGR03435 family)